MPDYIPDEDDVFDTYLRDQFAPYLAANFAALGLVAGDNTALQAASQAWGYAWIAKTNADAAAHGANEDKNLKRQLAEAQIRLVANKVQANPAVTALQKEGLGITVRKTSRTPAPVPTTTPTMLTIDTSTRAVLGLLFADSATPDSRAKPAGVQSCEIRQQIGGTAPVDPDDMPFLANETRTPYRADFDAGEVGATVYFALRWVNTRGKPGPWSQVYAAVVPS